MAIVLALASYFLFTPEHASASHSWGNYHWARTSNPFTVKLGDNVSSTWDPHLAVASSDWSASSVLDTAIVAGQGGKNCAAVSGTVQVCNKKYGYNGWLGIAQIWVSGSHIVKATTKMNDSYFNLSTYNKPEWRQFVICQEIGHTFGLDHQDEDFYNENLGTCMDYTNSPVDNQHPNAHDYEQLEIIYSHLDSSTTLASSPAGAAFGAGDDAGDGPDFGRPVRRAADGRASLFERDLGNGKKIFTFVYWAGRGAPRD
jgi:hypothetical protein